MQHAQARVTSMLGDVPAALREEIVAALARVNGRTGVSFVEVLRLAADAQLARALADRDDPLKLLAADALITYVCQVTSEENPKSLATLL